MERNIFTARNPVQFQKGINLNEFFSLYGTEDRCFDALYRWRWPNGFVCSHHGHDRHCRLTNRKLQQCNRCHRQTSITAGTVFDSTKLALTVWFRSLYLMTQDKKGVSAMKLHRRPGISCNAAWRIRHRLMQVMKERDRQFPLAGWSSSMTPIPVASGAGASAGVGRRPGLLSWPPSRPVGRGIHCA